MNSITGKYKLVLLAISFLPPLAFAGDIGKDPTGKSAASAAGPPTPADSAAQAFSKTTYAFIILQDSTAGGITHEYEVNCVTDRGDVDFTHWSNDDPDDPYTWDKERLEWWQGNLNATTLATTENPFHYCMSTDRAGNYSYSENLPDPDPDDGEFFGRKGVLKQLADAAVNSEIQFPKYPDLIDTQIREWQTSFLEGGVTITSFDATSAPIVSGFRFFPLEDGTAFGTVQESRDYTMTKTYEGGSNDFTIKSNHSCERWGHWGASGSNPLLFDGATTRLEVSNFSRYAGMFGAGGMGDNAFFLTLDSTINSNNEAMLSSKLWDKTGNVLPDLAQAGMSVGWGTFGTSRNGHIARRMKDGCTLYQYPSKKTDKLDAAFGSGAGGEGVQVNDVGDLLIQNARYTDNVTADMLVRKFTDPATNKTVWGTRQFSADTLPEGWSGLQIDALANAQPLAKQRELEALTPPAYPPKPEDTPAPMLGGIAMKNGKQYPVMLVPVTVTWSAIAEYDNVDAQVDPWTNKTNGKRIFPDYKDPDDTTMRDKLELIVTTSPALFGKTVYVKAFDVDDSTDESIDHERFGDPATPPVIDTDDKGDDNLDDYKDTPKVGQFWTGSTWGGATATGTVDVNGETRFVFGVGMQPGNNYRVVASVIDESMYTGIQTSDPAAAKYLGHELAQNGAAPASPLLTVWRRLWVENDSMKAIDSYPDGDLKNDLTSDMQSPTIQQVFASTDITTFYIPTISDRTSFTGPQNGILKFPGTVDSFTSFQTIPNMSTGVDAIQVAGNQGHIHAGAVFRLYDDDGFGLAGAPLPRNDLVIDDVIKRAYKPAFIEVMDARQWNRHDTVDFYRNHPPAVGNFLTGYDYGILDDALDAKLEGNENLWCASIMVAYQPGSLDSDPNEEANGVNSGTTPVDGLLDGLFYSGKARVSIIYSEVVRDVIDESLRNGSATIQDYEQRLRLTAAHEIGHQPLYGIGEAAQHAEDGLMADGGHNGFGSADTPFAAKSIKRFREVHQWRQKEQ